MEARLALERELSVVLARTAGETVAYAVAENVHESGILDLTVVPARIDPSLAADAARLGAAIAEHLDYRGVLAVELFVVDGAVLVNELAPRPHNSGHWTLDGARTSQFVQHIRAITGAALGDPAMTAPGVAMVNLLGELWFGDETDDDGKPREPDWTGVLAARDARLHLYGKSQPRPGRKMGHLTVLAADPTAAAHQAMTLRAADRPLTQPMGQNMTVRSCFDPSVVGVGSSYCQGHIGFDNGVGAGGVQAHARPCRCGRGTSSPRRARRCAPPWRHGVR